MTVKTIAIVGGGCSGTMIAAQQMLKLMEHKAILNWADITDHQINIEIYDKNGAFGRGEPYAQDGEAIFLLNQPAYAMSPFLDYPNHFCSWLANNQYIYKQDDFVPREIYGQYLEEVFTKAVNAYEASGCGNVEVITSTITDVTQTTNNSYSLISEDSQANNANIVVLASGHCRSDLLSEYNHHARYFSASFDKERAQHILVNATDPAMIIGTSQSMLDGLALLDHTGFQNQIYALSRHLVKPWVFDAKAHRENNGTYEYEFLTKDVLLNKPQISFEELKTLFESELKSGKQKGFPMGHIISQFNNRELMQLIQAPDTKDDFEQLVRHVRALYGNSTSPERFKLMNEYVARGQLEFIQADILEAGISSNPDGFNVTIKGGDPMKLSALFNSSSYSMKAILDNGYIASPLLDKLHKAGALKYNESDKNAFAFGEQNWNNLYIAGPACNSQRWGVETFRDSLANIAENSIQNIVCNVANTPI